VSRFGSSSTTRKGAGGGGLDAVVLRRRAERRVAGLPIYRRRLLHREATRARAWARAGVPDSGRLQARQDATHRAQHPTHHYADSQAPRAGCGLGQGTLGRRDADLGKARVGARTGVQRGRHGSGAARAGGARRRPARDCDDVPCFESIKLQKIE
jgi:hypothetical protein